MGKLRFIKVEGNIKRFGQKAYKGRLMIATDKELNDIKKDVFVAFQEYHRTVSNKPIIYDRRIKAIEILEMKVVVPSFLQGLVKDIDVVTKLVKITGVYGYSMISLVDKDRSLTIKIDYDNKYASKESYYIYNLDRVKGKIKNNKFIIYDIIR